MAEEDGKPQEKPAYVMEEPIATGALRTEFFGDTERGKSYVQAARRQMGAMKTFYGVNERVANGEPGGFYRDTRELSDGTRIETMTNDGLDTVRIRTPELPPGPPPEPWEPPTVDPVHHTPEPTHHQADPISHHEQQDPEPFEFTPDPFIGPHHQEDASVEPPPIPPQPLPEPYFWIGVRQLNNRYDPELENWDEAVHLHVCLWEPREPAEDGGVGPDPEVLSNRWFFEKSTPEDWDGAKTPLRLNRKRETITNPKTGETFGDLYYTDHLLYMVDRHAPSYNANARLVYDPDPFIKEDPDEWDWVFVLDPWQGFGINLLPRMGQKLPADRRGHIPDREMMIETGTKIMDKIIKGDYCLKIMASGDDCDQKPTKVLIEVKTLKNTFMTRDRYEIEVQGNTELMRGILPGGYYNGVHSPCSSLGGTNPHRDHWFQNAILIDPYGGSEMTPDTFIPDWGFDPGAGWPSQKALCSMDWEKAVVGYKFTRGINTYVDIEVLRYGRCLDFMCNNYLPGVAIAHNLASDHGYDNMAFAAWLRRQNINGIYYLSNHSGEGRWSVEEVAAAMPTSWMVMDEAGALHGPYGEQAKGWHRIGTTGEFEYFDQPDFWRAWEEAFGWKVQEEAPTGISGCHSMTFVYDPRTNTVHHTGIYHVGNEAVENWMRARGFTHQAWNGHTEPDGTDFPPFVQPLYSRTDDECD